MNQLQRIQMHHMQNLMVQTNTGSLQQDILLKYFEHPFFGKQRNKLLCVTLSSTEAEETVKELIELLLELGIETGTTTIYEDNISCIKIKRNPEEIKVL